MTPQFIRRLRSSFLGLALLTLAMLAGLWPPGPYRPAYAQAATPKYNIYVPLAANNTAWTGEPGANLFVDPAKGNDNNKGTESNPFKTIKKALSKAQPGCIVHLAAGSYTPAGSGDTYPLLVPDGVTIVGTLASNGAKRSFLSPATSAEQAIGLTFAGNATIKDLEMDVFGTAILADQSDKVTLSNVNFILNGANVSASGSAQATITNSHLSVGNVQRAVSANKQAQVTIKTSVIEGAGGCATGTPLLQLRDTSQMLLEQVTMKSFAGIAFSISETARANLRFSTIERRVPDGCTSNLATVRSDGAASLTLDASTLRTQSDTPATTLLWQSTAELKLTRSSLQGGKSTGEEQGTGIDMFVDAPITVEQSQFFGNQIGIDASVVHNSLVSITGSQLLGEVVVIAPKLRLRNTTLQCRECIRATGYGVDLGTSADPGGNTIKAHTLPNNNAAFGLTVEDNLPGAIIQAVGNTWLPNVQGADSQGHYTKGTQVSSTSSNAHGMNFDLSAGTKIQF